MAAESAKNSDAVETSARSKDGALEKPEQEHAKKAEQKLTAESLPGLDKKTSRLTSQPGNFIDLTNPYESTNALNAESASASKSSQTDQTTAPEKQPEPPKAQSLFDRAYDFVDGAGDYVKQAVEGAAVTAYTAVTERPGETALMLAEGAAIGVAVIATAPIVAAAGAGTAVVAGVAFAADATIVGLTAYGATKTAEDLYHGAVDTSGSADVLMHKSAHTEAEIDAAQKDVRDKMGGVSLEVAGAAMMTFGAVGSGARIVGAIKGGKFAGTLGAAEPLLPEVVVDPGAPTSSLPDTRIVNSESSPVLAPDSPVRPFPNGKASFDGSSVNTRTPQLPDMAFAHEAPPESIHAMNAEKPPTKVEATSIEDRAPLLPAGTVEHFSNRIGDFLEQRQDAVDLLKINDAIAQKANDLMDFHAEAERHIRYAPQGDLPPHEKIISLSMKILEDPAKAEPIFNRYPELKPGYDSYLKTKQEQTELISQREDELAHRRIGLANIMNEEAGKLFPDGVTPEFRLTSLSPKSSAEGTYLYGDISIPDKQLVSADPLRNFFSGKNLPSVLVHEMKHGEQDGLLVRKSIDIVTGGDTTGRALTAEEREAIRSGQKAFRNIPDKIIDDINAARGGRPLTAAESQRADAIERSFEKHTSQELFRQVEQDRLYILQEEYSLIDPEFASSVLRDEDHLSFMFKGKIPNQVIELREEWSKLPKDLDGHVEYDEDFENRAAKVLKPALEAAIAATKKSVSEGYQEYRASAHELESWSTHEEAEQRLGVVDEKVKQNSLKELLLEIFKDVRTEPVAVDRVQNAANSELFSTLENWRDGASPEAAKIYDKVLRTIANEKDDLSKAGPMKRLSNSIWSAMPRDLPEDASDAYDTIGMLLDMHGVPDLKAPDDLF